MRSHRLNRRDITTGLALLLATSCAPAQTLPGLWGSPLYRVQLNVSGSTVTGTFTSVENPQAPPGSIRGQLLAGGKAFTATWTAPAGPDTATFSTYLSFGARDSLLTGYRWSGETEPTSFALHRAVNGQVPVVIGPEDAGVGPGGGGTTGPVGVEGIEVIVCETAPNGQPQNIATEFVTPKSVTALVKHTNLPAGTTIQFLWTRDGQPRAELTKTREGTGWQSHSLTSDTAVAPGRYHLTVKVNGRVAAERDIIVRGPGGGTTGGTTGGTAGASPPGGSVELIICARAPNGQPQGISDDFTAPKSLTALVKYTKLPAGTALRLIWTRDGQPREQLERVKEGSGWISQSLTSDTALTPGRYHVSLLVNGRSAAERDITVRGAGGGSTSTTPTVLQTFNLTGPTVSGLLAKKYDRNNFEIKLTVTWTKTGVVLDTVGINAAPVGSFSVVIIDGNGKMQLQVYAPNHSSPCKVPNGWHVMVNNLPVQAGTPGDLTINRNAQGWRFSVATGGKQQTVTLALPVPASGDPIYVGDFPGDDSWPASLNPHRGMTGTVKLLGFTGKQQ